MIVVTSISPSHKNFLNQKKAVNSWIKLGLTVSSFNIKEEIVELEEKFKEVKFKEVSLLETSYKTFKRPCVLISTLIEKGFEIDDKVIFVNSDIEVDYNLKAFKKIEEKSEEGLVFISRHNYTDYFRNSKRERWGIDCFIFKKEYKDLLPKNDILSMGQCYWDYWVPFHFMKNKLTKPNRHVIDRLPVITALAMKNYFMNLSEKINSELFSYLRGQAKKS